MNVAAKAESVYFSIKGQVVIPRRLRKEFEIEEGTRAYVESTPEGILIKPVTTKFIRSLRDKRPAIQDFGGHIRVPVQLCGLPSSPSSRLCP